jgi:hypothetical protein
MTAERTMLLFGKSPPSDYYRRIVVAELNISPKV